MPEPKNLYKYFSLIAVLFLLSNEIAGTRQKPIKIVFINPGVSNPKDPTGGFWNSVSSFMKAAATDLNINLEVLYSERNRITMVDLAKKVSKRKSKPDYIIFVNEQNAAKDMLLATHHAGIKSFVILNSFTGKQKNKIGTPRTKYDNFIGSLVPDHEYAGYRIAKSLIRQASLVRKNVKVKDRQMIALAGDHVTYASVQRNKGLKRAVKESKNVALKQVFVGHWRQDRAEYIVKGALKRYPETDIIWAANDPMALGSISAANQVGRRAGKDIFIGGLNWDKPALKKVKNRELSVSVGGHFMTGGWALVLLYDYHHNIDFKSTHGPELVEKMFTELNHNNIDLFLNSFKNRNWNKIDFKKFSKYLNKNLRQYNFTFEAILSQLSR